MGILRLLIEKEDPASFAGEEDARLIRPSLSRDSLVT